MMLRKVKHKHIYHPLLILFFSILALLFCLPVRLGFLVFELDRLFCESVFLLLLVCQSTL